MIRIKNVTTLSGKKIDVVSDASTTLEIDGSNLTALPALIDPHVHFRVPGGEHKEDWKTGSLAALHSGVTCVLDMPNNIPSVCTVDRLLEKKKIIDSQLKAIGIPLDYALYLGADKHHLEEISKAHGTAIGVKVFMGCSTGELLIDTQKDLEEVFRRAQASNLVVAVHAEDEALLNSKKKQFQGELNPSIHSVIRDREVAQVAVNKALEAAAKYDATLYLLHLSTKEEMELVRQAKKSGIKVFAETTPHHLFLSTNDYKKFGTLVQMNPPLREYEDQEALWEAINDQTLDTIGTDHAPHTLLEKRQPYGKAPSGIPGVDTYLSLLLNSVHEKKITLQKLTELTRTNIKKIFDLKENDDLVLVDLNMQKELLDKDIKSKCGWSPYCGRVLTGWPIYTRIKGNLFTLRKSEEKCEGAHREIQHAKERRPDEAL